MQEVFVYVHGVVGRHAGPHLADYRAFRRGLSLAGISVPPVEQSVTVEWGWPTPVAPKTGELALAQERLSMALARPGNHLNGFLVEPLRRLIQYGWSDLVYYATPEGEYHARHDAWSQILDGIPADRPVDLTIIAHGVGCLLAHDFLLHLFSGTRRSQRRAVSGSEDSWGSAEANWRLRRLVTLGSPLGPLLVRRPGMVARLASEPSPWLDPGEIGLDQPAHSGESPLWVNVWDRHDITSFPVGGLYAGDRVVDLYPDFSDWARRAHARYWRARKVSRAIAQYWDA